MRRIREAFLGESFTALRCLEPTAEQVVASANDQVAAWALLILANAREEEGLGDEALDLVARARRARPDEPALQVNAIVIAVEVHLRRVQFERCGALLAEVEPWVQRSGLPRLEFLTANLRGRVAIEEEDLQGALRAFETALDLATELDMGLNLGRVLANLGSLHHANGSPKVALEHYERAYEVISAFDDWHASGVVRHNMARLKLGLERFDEALVDAQEAQKSMRRADNAMGSVSCDMTRIRGLVGRGDLEQARVVAAELLVTMPSWSAFDGALGILANLAEKLWDLREVGGLRMALARLIELQHAAGATESETLSLSIWESMARAADGEHEAVLRELPALLDTAERDPDPDILLSAIECAVVAHEAAGDLGKALELQRRHNRLETQKLYRMMDTRLAAARALGETNPKGLHARDLERRVQQRMDELAEVRQRLELEAEERRESAARERELERGLLAGQRLESIGRLAGGVAHDFNNLLTVVRGNAQRLSELSGKEGRVLSAEILLAATRGANLVSQLLAFSRRGEVFMEDCRLDEVVETIAPLLERLIGEDLELRLDLCAGQFVVHADRAQLESVIVNLVLNAREAMPSGGLVRIETAAGSGDEVLLFVRDEGDGIALEHRELIFDPFFTTRGDSGGTGMGLSSALGIAGRFGGGLRLVESSRFGTVFELQLPARLATAEEGHSEPPKTVVRERDSACLKGRHVLVVEDNEAICRIVQSALQRAGASADVAFNGHDALELVTEEKRHYDLVVTDVVMPGMGGPQLFQELSELGSRPPFLFTSGYPDQWSLDELTLASDVSFLAKPFDLAALVEAVAGLLAESTSPS